MFIEKLKETFGYNIPIFTNEILDLFPEYTRAYIFRMMKKAISDGSLVQVDKAVYYIPESTKLGLSTITASDIIKKKYIENNSSIYGIYGGLVLQNGFSLTTQIANIPEIITNKEATRSRKITVNGRTFILKKSRTQINSDNVHSYTILQLFTENNGIEINDKAKKYIGEYIKENKIKKEDLLNMSKSFPDKTLKKLMYSGVLNETL